MNGKRRLRRRLRYRFDHSLSRGPGALILWLALATALLVVTAVVVTLLLGAAAGGMGVEQAFWNFAFQALVPNPPADLSTPWPFLAVMLVVTLASLAMVSILIGLLAATIQTRVETLRRGRTPIIERDHTVILGWSEQVIDIVVWLNVAARYQRKAVVAVLGERDKVEMEDAVRQRVKPGGRTRVVVRRGSPTQFADLDLVSPQTSKAIVILPGDNKEYPDVLTLKTIMALTHAPNRRPDPYRIVAVLQRERNVEIARMVAGDEVELVLSGDVIARIIAQTCRQPGLSLVYGELLDAAGDEIYFQAEPALVGKTFGEALFAYEDSAVIGLCPDGGAPQLNPDMETLIRPGDQIIAISEDQTTVRLSGSALVPLRTEAIQAAGPVASRPERTLMLGWNRRAGTVLRQLDHYVAAGSQTTVVASDERVAAEIETLAANLRRQDVRFRQADTSSRPVLEGLLAEGFDHVVVMSYSDAFEDQLADALTMLTLLQLGDLAAKGGYEFSLASEMMDARNRDLVWGARGHDFILGDQVIGQMMIQISQNAAMNLVLHDLLDPAGSEIYLKPATDYIRQGEPVSFSTVVEAARRRGEVAIGYRVKAWADDRDHGYGVVVNPLKSAVVSFAPGDRVIVLAQE